MLFQQVGPALHWTPILQLELVTLPFNSDLPGRMLTYSVLNFLLLLARFYLVLLLLSMVNRKSLEADPIQKWVRLQIGAVARWPAAASLVMVLILAIGCW